jgi:two-component system, chemotaxis family, sensor kinase CheA
MDPLETIKQGYFQECEELLLAMEEGLIAMENGETDSETINAVFRAVHSIKGGGGAFGFEDLVSFAHCFETVMDLIRSGKLEPEPEVMKVLLRAGDMLSDHVNAARTGSRLDPAHDEDSFAELKSLSGDAGEEEAELKESYEELGFHQLHLDDLDDGSAPAPAAAPVEPNEPAEAETPVAEPAPVDGGKGWIVRFTPRPELYAKANEPSLLIRELGTLGEMKVVADLSKLPRLDTLDPEQAYIAWTITLVSDEPREKVEEVFEFASDDCELDIRPTGESRMEASALQPEELPASAEPVLTEAPAVEAVVAETPAPKSAPAPVAEPPRLVAVTPGKPAELECKLEAAPLAGKPEKKEAPAGGEGGLKQSIRVDLDKIDRLGNVVGEMVITQAMLAQRLTEFRSQSPLLANNIAEMEHLLRELQEGVMAIRTQPVKSVFQRMPRLVRELAAQTGKQARLVIKGEATEVDKTVIERLGEPLTHMIRNAIDHGLETPDDRAAAGKDPEGAVTLSAEHRGGRIVIEVIDDGRGINRARVREKALEKGLIQPNANMTDEEIDNLIFLPGFSTAGQVSNISGRGVGMDVVKRSVIDLGGRVILSSTPGKGSRFTMTLPLTLAVLDGMAVAVGEQTFVLPLTHIIESLQPRPQDIRPFGVNRSLLKVRDKYVPLIRVGELFNVAGTNDDPTAGVIILVESEGTGRLALAVDQILGQRQVVIKSFEANYRHIEGIGAATILGDGRVALIIDVDGIVIRCKEKLADSGSHELSATGTGP